MTLTQIDGSILEGGGQLIRMSIGLSALLKKPIRIINIRAGRSKPGLKAQHMCGLRLVQQLAGGKLEGCVLNSTEITYYPRSENKNNPVGNDHHADDFDDQKTHFQVDITTNGAVTLLSQVSLPVCLFRKVPTILDLIGGTQNSDTAPPVDYYQHVFLHHLKENFGIDIECNIIKRSYNYPKGGGHLQLKIKPMLSESSLPPISILPLPPPNNSTTEPEKKSRQIKSFSIHAFTAGKVPHEVAHQMASGACNILRNYCSSIIEESTTSTSEQAAMKVNTQHYDHNLAVGNGSSVFIKANVTALAAFDFDKEVEEKDSSKGRSKQIQTVLAASADGNVKINPQKTGAKAAKELVEQLNLLNNDDSDSTISVIDQYAQDQLIIFMALARGKSQIKTGKGKLTLHTKTAIYIAELLTSAKFNVNETNNLIECQGIGYYSNHKK